MPSARSRWPGTMTIDVKATSPSARAGAVPTRPGGALRRTRPLIEHAASRPARAWDGDVGALVGHRHHHVATD